MDDFLSFKISMKLVQRCDRIIVILYFFSGEDIYSE